MHIPAFAVSTALTCLLAGSVKVLGQDDLVSRAHQLDMQGDHRGAIALYQQVLDRNPKSFDAQYGIARAQDLAGDYADARHHFAAAIDLAPEDLKDQSLRMLGISYVFTGDIEKAAGYFRQVFDRDRAASNPVSAAEVANELGRVYLESGDTASAFTWYQTGYDTARHEPDAAPWQLDLADLRWAHAQARIEARRGDFDAARQQEAVVKRLIDKGTNNDQDVQYPYLLGYVDFYAKNYAAAIVELRKADQQDPFVLCLLAQSFEATGDTAQAREYYRKTLASNSHAVNNAFVRRLAADKLQSVR